MAVQGAGLTGSVEVAASSWIKIVSLADSQIPGLDQAPMGLGLGELSAICLAKQIAADIVLIDEIKARRFARAIGLRVIGCVGILELAYTRGLIPDLRQAYRDLMASGAYDDSRLLEQSLKSFNLPPQ